MIAIKTAAAALCLAFVVPAGADAKPRKQRKPVYDYNQPKGGCNKFTWPVTRELDWFAQDKLPKIESGAKRPALPGSAFTLDLESDTDASFVMPPERKSRQDNGYGGAVSFDTVPRAGLYQITLSEDGLVDVIQDGKYLRKKGSSMRRDCPSIRRSIRADLAAGPLVLQLNGVEMPFVTIAIAPVE